MTDQRRKLLVTGAGGKLGGRVIELLLERNAGAVVAVTRDPARLKGLVRRGVEVRHGDFDDPASLPAAFTGVDRALIISTDAVGQPGTRKRQHVAAVEAAASVGVKHILYTSAPAPHPDPAFEIADDHYWSEQAVAASPGGWTILRNNLYAEVALAGLANALASGKLLTASHGGGRSYVTRDDCAEAAAAALADGFEGRRILDVTGPAAVTQAELAEMGQAITGRDIAVVDMDADALRRTLVEAGVPEAFADLAVGFDRDAALGTYAVATPVVLTLTGRAPTPLRAFLERNREALTAKAA